MPEKGACESAQLLKQLNADFCIYMGLGQGAGLNLIWCIVLSRGSGTLQLENAAGVGRDEGGGAALRRAA